MATPAQFVEAPPPPLPPPPPPPLRVEEPEAPELAAEKALVPLAPGEAEPLAVSPALARLPVELDVTIPVRQFRVRNLLALEPGQVIESRWANGEDLPLAAGEVQLAWAEFEVVDSQLAVRLTRLI